MTATVRRMRWWDLDRVCQLDDELFQSTAWSEEIYWSELAGVPEERWYVVAEYEGDIVGFAGLAQRGHDADVQTLGVHAAAQRQGVGSLLLRALVDEAVSRGARQILLEVRSDNDPAGKLYAKHGFVAIDRRRGYYGTGVDATIMRCQVKANT